MDVGFGVQGSPSAASSKTNVADRLQQFSRPFDLVDERQAQVVLEDDADDAQRGAAELIGIARARRLLADSPEADQHVELVGQRHGHGGAVAFALQRHRVGRALRLVVQLDGARDGRVHVLGLGVVAAHEALQLGEFADHAGDEVGLGQLGGALGERRLAQLLRVAICRASSLTRSARSNCVPSFSWKVMPFSSSRIISSFFLRSCSQKNLASDEARRDHLLVAGDDGLAAVPGLLVGDQQEVVRQLLAVAQREALLVRLHRRRQALGRHVEERLVELAHSTSATR